LGTRRFAFTTQATPHGGIEFSFLFYGRDFLRTSRSPPAALQPILRRRSCSPVTGYVDLERTFAAPTVRFQAHVAASLPRHVGRKAASKSN